MYGLVIGLLTIVMVLDCLMLVGLVLIQLPKKDTGGGLAFGGGASDALFGAGSGNVLTKITKYAATIFFILAVLLSVLQKNYHSRNTTEFEKNLSQPGSLLPQNPPSKAAPAPVTPPPVTLPSTNSLLNLPVPTAGASNAAPASATSNAVPTAPK